VTPIPPLRRFALAAIALGCAIVLFRANVASALVTRGDDQLRTGDLSGAVRHYLRATQLDPRSATAVDRLAFVLLMRRGRGDAALAFALTDAALRTLPRDPMLLADRGFAGERLGRWRGAERDFTVAARLSRDPRYAHLAARMALRAGDPASARAHLRAAIAIDPGYAPARPLLRRLGA
jgi:tetratricopeptide (TPR) repeat protein